MRRAFSAAVATGMLASCGGSAKLGVPHALLSALPPPLPPRTPRRAEEVAGQGEEEEEGGGGAEGWHLSESSGSASSLIALPRTPTSWVALAVPR